MTGKEENGQKAAHARPETSGVAAQNHRKRKDDKPRGDGRLRKGRNSKAARFWA